MAGIRDLEEILRRVTDIQGDGFGGLERGYDFIDVEQAKAELEQLIKEKQTEARIEQIKSMVVTDSESDWDGNKLVWGYIDIRTDDINEVIAELEGEE